ncbi:MAG: methylamine utilization protein MauG [Epsilonproteobacteria bacterium]|nr:MAG: methylamine utilization protein MauG [Campylobacterota bacterium]
MSVILFTACGGSSETDTTSTETTQSSTVSVVISTKEELGESLFSDTSLSLTRTMSCATCHDPLHAFIDTRANGVNGAVSLGDDGSSLGDRNSPMASYASFTPSFDLTNLSGGQFLDGRALDLTEQAKGPFLNPVEMQMPDESSVIDRVRENDSYVATMESLYGETIFDDTDSAYTAIADAIAAFESTAAFSPFDSDFDTNTMSAAAIRGRDLFRSRRVNCVRCHDDRGDNALFTNFTYENLGLPANTNVRSQNGHGLDHGLLDNPDVSAQTEDGKFKVNSLRNVAVTAPYMHNGVFQDLKTVVHFYNTRDTGGINPETGSAWEAAEINRPNIVTNDVGNLGLSDAEEDDIVAFLEALTDAKYKDLIP